MNRDHHPLPARLHMVGNAHIDPMWIWDWREGMHEVLQTFRSAVDRLDEEPALVFTASSASYYQWVEQTLAGAVRTHQGAGGPTALDRDGRPVGGA